MLGWGWRAGHRVAPSSSLGAAFGFPAGEQNNGAPVVPKGPRLGGGGTEHPRKGEGPRGVRLKPDRAAPPLTFVLPASPPPLLFINHR